MQSTLSSLWWRYWLPPLGWVVVILLLSGDLGAAPNSFSLFKWVVSWFVTLSPARLSQLHFLFRKALHVICYGVQALLWLRALMATRPGTLRANLLVTLALCLAVALMDEGHQHFLTSRTGSLWDVALDMSGAASFALLSRWYWKRRKPALAVAPLP